MGRRRQRSSAHVCRRISPRCAACRGVVDAYATNSYPLSNGGYSRRRRLDPDQEEATVLTAHVLRRRARARGIGLKLIAGRNFKPMKSSTGRLHRSMPPDAVIITRALGREAVSRRRVRSGKAVYIVIRQAMPCPSSASSTGCKFPGCGGRMGRPVLRQFDSRAVPLVVPQYVLHRARKARPDGGRDEGGAEEALRLEPRRGCSRRVRR